VLTKQKLNLSYLYVYDCKVYPLNKYIPCLQKLQPRAHIGYLIGYESMNIFRIWIPSQEKVVRTRDVTFNEEQFYDPAELDIEYILRETADQVIEILDTPQIAYTQSNSLTDEEDINEILVSAQPAQPVRAEISSQHESTPDSIAMPTPCDSSAYTPSQHLLTPDATPDPPTQPISTANSAPAPLENRSDFNDRNILPEGSKRSRKSPRCQNYAIALSQAAQLTPFHIAFALGREKAGGVKIEGLHRDTLPAEPRTWRQLTQHRFAAEFEMAADREIQDLTRRDTFKWVKKEVVTAVPLPLL
jgi:hypothetical protein